MFHLCPDTASGFPISALGDEGIPMCFPISLELGGPQKIETKASSIVQFSLDFGDTSKFGSSSIYNGWDL